MATYKVIQDIEAEDKLVGPLSLRQFVYALICVASLYLCFLVITNGIGFAAVIFAPPALLFGFLAVPWKGEQPTEVWALAKVQFLMKPRKRIWNQSGVKELVTITAPKRIERVLTNGLSQTEVKSRLRALADTIDSRGWVVKNVGPSMYNQAGLAGTSQSSDRLVELDALPQPVPVYTTQASDDILDMQNNPVAQKFNSMIAASQKAHREEIIERMKQAGTQTPPSPTPPNAVASTTPPAQDYWFLNQPTGGPSSIPQDAVTFNTQVVEPGSTPTSLPVIPAAPTADEEAFIKQLKNQPLMSPNMHGHLHVIQPLSVQKAAADAQAQAAAQAQQMANDQAASDVATAAVDAQQQRPEPPQSVAQQQVTAAPDAAILDLARNDDLNVATIAREAQKRKEAPDEVVISLH